MELLAATIGARLWNSVENALDYDKPDIFFWSDSTTVLAWIRRNKPWNAFVNNRVKEIRKLTPPEKWHYVPGTMNPADLPSRGCKSKQLLESRWWESPTWLKSTKEHWPSVEDEINEAEIDGEMKKHVKQDKGVSSNVTMVNTTCLSMLQTEQGWYMKKLPAYTKIVRSMGWILRFIFNSRKPRVTRLSVIDG